MNQTQIKWLGLHNNREKTIYIEAFWDGVNSSDDIKKQVVEGETNWAIERNDATAVPEIKTESPKCNDVVGWCR